ncbi:hypothetical protein E2562_019086 [Oryza meyeriana var. granulata]|uniref:Uncharacterized protein n=1 Tax=Oryza meyeriana var. granulata TaxID=110450 RepID=A0A6G1CT41_9ORYZ|nr:hypothetical protein E2562_019086 [Oryza meyeriana var. granulata]
MVSPIHEKAVEINAEEIVASEASDALHSSSHSSFGYPPLLSAFSLCLNAIENIVTFLGA